MIDPILAISRKKRKKRPGSERKAIIAEMKKPIKLNVKVTNYAFENWLEKQVKRAENRYLEAKMKNVEDWILMDCWKKKAQLRQVEINYLAIIY